MVGGLRDVITCTELQIEIFMGYDFTGGRIFDFPIDFSMGLTTVQRYCAACDRFPDIKRQILKSGLGVIQGHWKCHHLDLLADAGAANAEP